MFLPDEKTVLDGATANPQRLATGFYHAALICGLAPLATVSGVFLLWCVVDWTWLMFVGACVICGGIVSVMVGAGCLIAYAIKSWDTQPHSRTGIRVAIALAALLVNFPAALALIFAATYLALQIQVTVVNHGPAIERFVVSGGCTETDFGSIPSGTTCVKKIRIECDGNLEFHARRAGQELSGVIEGYVTPNDWAYDQITFNPDGDWSVQNLRPTAD